MMGRLARWLDRATADPFDFLDPPMDAPTDPVLLGHHAKRLLEDPVLNEALSRIKGKLASAFMGSQVGDTAGREACYRLNWAVQELEKELRLLAGNAAVNEAEHKAAAAKVRR